MNNILKILKLGDVKLPERTGRNAGFDFFIPNDFENYILKNSNGMKKMKRGSRFPGATHSLRLIKVAYRLNTDSKLELV